MVKNCLDQATMDSLNLLLSRVGGLQEEVNQKVATRSASTNLVSDKSINTVIQKLIEVVAGLEEKIRALSCQATSSSKASATGNEIEKLKADLDETHQRGLKGNLILTSASRKDVPSIFMSDEQLKEKNLSITDHVISLIEKKYNVVLPLNDIMACHRLPNNSIILRIWNRTSGSAWSSIIEGIKKGINPKMNFYANFQMTKLRSETFYHVRKLKKSGKIAKFYLDENASISIKKSSSSPKIKILPCTLAKLNEILA